MLSTLLREQPISVCTTRTAPSYIYTHFILCHVMVTVNFLSNLPSNIKSLRLRLFLYEVSLALDRIVIECSRNYKGVSISLDEGYVEENGWCKTAPLILKLSSGRGGGVAFNPQAVAPWYLWNRVLGVTQNRSEHFGEAANLFLLPGIEPQILIVEAFSL